MKTKFNLSDEEQERIFYERMQSEAQRPSTPEEKKRAKINQEKLEEYWLEHSKVLNKNNL